MAKQKVGLQIDESVNERITALGKAIDRPKGDLVGAALAMFLKLGIDEQRAAVKAYTGESIDRAFSSLAGDAESELDKYRGGTQAGKNADRRARQSDPEGKRRRSG